MARLEIDERAFSDPGLKMLAHLLGDDTTVQAMGYLVYLWHDSQELLKTEATTQEIITWCQLKRPHGRGRDRPDRQPEFVVEAMAKSGYLDRVDTQLWHIAGNKLRINCVKHRKEKARSASMSRWGVTIENQPSDTINGSGASRMLGASPKQCHHKSTRVQEYKSTNNKALVYDKRVGNVADAPLPDPSGGGRKRRLKKTHDPSPSGRTLMGIWNDHCGEHLSQVMAMRGKRDTHAKVRLAEVPDVTKWIEAVKKLATSDFCTGASDRGWRADIDFLLRPNSLEKILAGNYDNDRKRVPTNGAAVEEPWWEKDDVNA